MLNSERQTLTVDETARIMGIGRNSAYEAVKRGDIPSLKVGRRILVPKQALEVMLSSKVQSARLIGKDRADRNRENSE